LSFLSIFELNTSKKAFKQIGMLRKKVNIKRGINHCVLVRPSRYNPTPTSKNGAKLPTKQ
jgi:hypothetical protein